MELVLSKLSARRVIYYFEGYVRGAKPGDLKIVFYNYDLKVTIKPSVFEWDGDMFRMMLHVEQANGNAPMESGDYYPIAVDKKGKHYPFHVSQEIISAREKEEWKNDVSVNKSKGHHIICKSLMDLDTDELFININTVLPKPRKNYIRRKCGELYYGVRNDLKDFAQKLFVVVFRIFNKLCKKKGNKILFCSGSRAEIGGNEEFIYKRMLERGLDKQYKFVLDFKPTINKTYGPFKMIRFIYRLASSDVILLDDYYPEIYKPTYDENVKVIQVWHACGAFKALGLERMAKVGAPPINTSVHKCYTHVPVSSYHSALHHQEAFGISLDKFYPVGIPRTDIFFDEEYKKQARERVFGEFPDARRAKRVMLYAPTFRGNSAVDARFPMDKLDFEEWGEVCKRTNSYLIVKMHPFVQEKITIPEKYRDYIADAAQYREVNDILFITDLLITDYSSIIYEFSLLRRPMLFYAFDQIMYVSTRDFYEPYEEIVPGRIIKRFDQLMEAIEKEDYNTDKIDWFINKNFTYTDGKSTDRVIDLIIGKDTRKMSAVSMKGALAAVSRNFDLGAERKEKHYKDGDRAVRSNGGSGDSDNDETENDNYSE
ncbi:MAG: CDP-glycerol glycerophosphotransferase family protein [Lachnospiraceae bacterium]|nr:CDP-glycerol glycerophosphotransferase family protein [Lachnospiraceae bacterium]